MEITKMKENLKYLKLTRIEEIYEQEAKESEKKNLSYIEYLNFLINEEVICKKERAMRKRIVHAHFPVIKTLDAFDFNHPQEIDKQKVLRFNDLSFINKKENLIIMAASGLGKTHIAISIAYKACCAGYNVRFITAADMINHLYASRADNSLQKTLTYYTKLQLIVIDETGFLPFDKDGADLFFQVISKRYECGAIILTTNLAFKEWGKIFNNATAASAIIDRLAHHGEVLTIKGDSFRLKNKKNKEKIDTNKN